MSAQNLPFELAIFKMKESRKENTNLLSHRARSDTVLSSVNDADVKLYTKGNSN